MNMLKNFMKQKNQIGIFDIREGSIFGALIGFVSFIAFVINWFPLISRWKIYWIIKGKDKTTGKHIKELGEKAKTFAILTHDGRWMQKGEMGWFGMSYDKQTQKDWDNSVMKMFNELPDDTLITIVDCHI